MLVFKLNAYIPIDSESLFNFKFNSNICSLNQECCVLNPVFVSLFLLHKLIIKTLISSQCSFKFIEQKRFLGMFKFLEIV